MFRFNVHPAAIDVGGGFQAAWDLLVASWRLWLPVAVAVGAVQLIVAQLLSGVDTSGLFTLDPATGAVDWGPNASGALSAVLLGMGLLAIVGLLSSWFFLAIAIAGLRRLPLTAGWVVDRGLVALLGVVLIFVASTIATFVLAILLAAVPPLGVLVLLAGAAACLYAVVRLAFVGLAIFDGFGLVAALGESWRLSSGAFLRLLGWGLLGIGVSVVFAIVRDIALAPFSRPGLTAPAAAISSALGSALGCFLVFFLAVLYESQRARLGPPVDTRQAAYPYGSGGPPPRPPYPPDIDVGPAWGPPQAPCPAGAYPPTGPEPSRAACPPAYPPQSPPPPAYPAPPAAYPAPPPAYTPPPSPYPPPPAAADAGRSRNPGEPERQVPDSAAAPGGRSEETPPGSAASPDATAGVRPPDGTS